MTSVTLPHARRPFTLSPRLTGSALGLALAIAVFALGFRLSPAGVALGPGLVALIVGAAAIAHALTGTSEEIRSLNRGLIAGIVAALLAFASGLSGETLEPLFGLAALALLGRRRLAHRFVQPRSVYTPRRARRSGGARPGRPAPCLQRLVRARLDRSRDRRFHVFPAGFDRRRFAHRLRRALPQLVFETASSLKADYSWLPGILPGAALAVTAPLSRAAYQAALMVFYAAPALIALGWLARELASRAGLAPQVAPVAWRPRARRRRRGGDLSDRHRGGRARHARHRRAHALCLRAANGRPTRARRGVGTGEDAHSPARVDARTYVVCDVHLPALVRVRRGRRGGRPGARTRRCRATEGEKLRLALADQRGRAGCADRNSAAVARSSSTGPGEPAKHDYGNLYAAYRKPTDVFLGLIGDWWGFGVLALDRDRLCIFGVALTTGSPCAHDAARGSGRCSACSCASRRPTSIMSSLSRLGPQRSARLSCSPQTDHALRGLWRWPALAAATLTPSGALAPKGCVPDLRAAARAARGPRRTRAA